MKNEEKILSFFSKAEWKIEKGLLHPTNVLELGYEDVDLEEEYVKELDAFCVSDLLASSYKGCLPVVEVRSNGYRLLWVYGYVYKLGESFLLTTDGKRSMETKLKVVTYRVDLKQYLKSLGTEGLDIF